MQHAFFLLLLTLLLTALAMSTVRTGRLLQTWTPDYNLLLAWPDALLRLGLIAICLLLGVTLGPGAQALGLGVQFIGWDLAVGAGVGVALSAFMALLGRLVVRQWGAGVYSDTLLHAILPRRRREWAGVLLALLPAALLEELLFRALPLAGLAWLIAPRWLLWPLSVGFGLLHWPQGSWGVLGATLAAIVLGVLFILTGSLWAPLAAHYVMNVTQLLLAHLVKE